MVWLLGLTQLFLILKLLTNLGLVPFYYDLKNLKSYWSCIRKSYLISYIFCFIVYISRISKYLS